MSRVVFANGRLWAVARDGSLRHKLLSTEPPKWEEPAELPSPVRSIAACDDRISVYAACSDGSFHAFNAQTGELLRSNRFQVHAVPLCILPISNENALFFGLQDGTVGRCHLGSLAFDCMLGCGTEHKEAVNALAADDKYLYSAGEDAMVLVWDLKVGGAVREISMAREAIRSVLRVDDALWLGLVDGAVQVFDIVGDDSNGIELMVDKAPHNGPVSDLVRVGTQEVWSVAGHSSYSNVSQEYIPNVVKWDTQDLTFTAIDSVKERDLMSIAVVERSMFEEITVLAIDNSLDSKAVRTAVKGRLPPFLSVDVSDNGDTLESDYGSQTWESRGDSYIVASSRLYQQHVNNPSKGKPATGENMPPDNAVGDDLGKDQLTAPVPQSATPFPLDTADEEKCLHILPTSTSQGLLSTMRRISELLATLLTNNVLSAEGNTKADNHALRTRVATITQELNTGMQLIESSPVIQDINSPFIVGDENDLMQNNQNQGVAPSDRTAATLRLRLQKERKLKEQLEKNLRLVTKDRDMAYSELNEHRENNENAMSSYEECIRVLQDSGSMKDKEIHDLGKENRRLDDALKQVKGTLEEVAMNCENEKRESRHIIEKNNLEIEGQKKVISDLKSQNSKLLDAGKFLLEQFDVSVEQQKNELLTLRQEHEAHVRDLCSKHTLEMEKSRASLTQETSERGENYAEVKHLRMELESVSREFDSAKAEVRDLNSALEKKEEEFRSVSGSSLQLPEDIGSSSSISDQVRDKAEALKGQISILTEELLHRKSAADMYEEENRALDTGVSKYKAAAEELKKELSFAEDENRSLEKQLRHAREVITRGESHASQLQEQLERLRSAASKDPVRHDNAVALKALLTSANGEIEQMSSQIEAMQVVQDQQERELTGLREAMTSAETAVRKPANSGSGAANDLGTTAAASAMCERCASRSSSSVNNALVNETILEVQDGMDEMHEKLRDISNTARKYKLCAQAHVDILPALYELEAELLRVSREERSTANKLRTSRGVVQSVIAQYYSARERQGALLDCDEALYVPSANRLEALRQAVVGMRARRTGSNPWPLAATVASAPQLRRNVSLRHEDQDQLSPNDVETPRRLLTFN
ncbi:unnamed protein product [Chondrus crispus]|uniref:Uncharacterized protein n=1 Tax=Chondrus crispus TaxID=2769 RepID=R7QB88_CHOCR|nr:unnamed protein product [Chondrus crispus]CDF35008.1 unnamed protein product [Chondrus crispus]|eukprot:XP_005714827.1 unnamed protein product [Chondrus crispus]